MVWSAVSNGRLRVTDVGRIRSVGVAPNDTPILERMLAKRRFRSRFSPDTIASGYCSRHDHGPDLLYDPVHGIADLCRSIQVAKDGTLPCTESVFIAGHQ